MKVSVLFVLFALALPAWAEDNRWIIAFKKDVSFEYAKSYVASAGAKIVLEQPAFPFVAAMIEDSMLAQKIGLLDFVDYIEEDVRRYPISINPSTVEGRLHAIAKSKVNVTGSTQVTPYGITMVQADQVSDINSGAITVCIIDSGYDIKHEDLPTSTVSGVNTGWNNDGCNHGTHVAGTIAAVDNEVGVIGVLPNSRVKLLIVQVFGADCAWTYSSGLADAATKCQAGGANILSMSLGSSLPSATERTTFDNLYNNNNILNFAAAGNDGTSRNSYPAGYAGVISVAAVDSNQNKASFSQYNTNVEVAAPGVGVLSTVSMGTGESSSFTVNGNAFTVYAMSGDSPDYESPKGDTGVVPLCNCGQGVEVCNCKDQLCLIERGTNSFAEKVVNCQNGGGLGAVIYNNAAGAFVGTLGSVATTIPSASLSQADGQAALQSVGKPAQLVIAVSNYEYYDGTSMATPHASAVAALVWSVNPSCSAATIRSVLKETAIPGATQKTVPDVNFGYGILQARAAADKILNTPSLCTKGL